MMKEKLQNSARPSNGVAVDLSVNNAMVLPESGLGTYLCYTCLLVLQII